ncbi:protein of unknown function [Burkholderia multivorans]
MGVRGDEVDHIRTFPPVLPFSQRQSESKTSNGVRMKTGMGQVRRLSRERAPCRARSAF